VGDVKQNKMARISKPNCDEMTQSQDHLCLPILHHPFSIISIVLLMIPRDALAEKTESNAMLC